MNFIVWSWVLTLHLLTVNSFIHHNYSKSKVMKKQFLIILNTSNQRAEELVDWLALPCDNDSSSTNIKTLLPAVRRSFIHKNNLFHRGIGAILLRAENTGDISVFVHKRASTKRLFPSMWDMFIGGVSTSGEPPMTTLFRELEEECGLDSLSKDTTCYHDMTMKRVEPVKIIKSSDIDKNMKFSDGIRAIQISDYVPSSETSTVIYVGNTIVKTSLNHCLVSCFLVLLNKMQSETISFKDGEIESGDWMSLSGLETSLSTNGDADFVPDGMQVIAHWNLSDAYKILLLKCFMYIVLSNNVIMIN